MKATLSKSSILRQRLPRSTRRPSERQPAAAVGPIQGADRAVARSPAPSVVWTPFYGRGDWVAFLLATVVVLGVYLWTLAPDLTLEDSGEMAVAAQHLGVPHPPGYPVWTLYAWTFTKLLPFSNMAWRVAVSSAVAGALACGLIALMVARASRLLVDHFRGFGEGEPRWRTRLSVASGVIAGALFGFSGFVWSQAVIVEVYTLSVLSLTGVMACLFRWMHVPHQRRYLYLAWFLFGICLNNHQSLIVAALAIEVCVALADARLGRDLFLGNVLCYALGLFGMTRGWVGMLEHNGPLLTCYHVIGLGSLAMMVWLTARTKALGKEFRAALGCAGVFLIGAGFYLLLPVFSMSNPPMNWAYPRTVPGFLHALTRGQYEPIHPSTSLGQYLQQLGSLARGILEEFNPVWLAFGLLPLLLLGLRRLQAGPRAWMIGGTAFYVALGPGLLVLLNPGNDRGSQALVRVFFAASQVPVAMAIGLGVALALAWALTPATQAVPNPQRAPGVASWPRSSWLLLATAIAGIWGLAHLLWTVRATELSLARNAALFSLGLTLVLGVLAGLARGRWPAARVVFLAACCLMPVHSVLSHWWANEQRGHLFGFWFGHDMFTPPLRGAGGQLTYARAERQRALATSEGTLVYPEMARDAVLFGGTDPGRFCPTYMIFSESVLRPDLRRDPEFDRRDVSIITQNALADAHYLEYIRAHYQRSAQWDPPFFSELLRSQQERDEGRTNVLARLALPLDRALANLGGAIEKRRRDEGLYPAKELRLPSHNDLQRCLAEYVRDWQERARRGQLNPAEVVQVNGQQAQLGGPAAVMGVNALLTRQIFEQNPDREFYVEESFPLEWMYPHLTPFGTILKLERQPPRELGPEVVARDRKFWSDYLERLIGDWVKPETNIAEICTFAEQVHVRRELAAYRGDRKFLRDEQAQKAFSKLRSSIAGVYDWRFRSTTGLLHQVTQRLAQAGLGEAEAQALRVEQQRLTAEQTRMFREAEFASKQAYALCPFSPEAFQRLVNLLLSSGRVSEALAIAETSQKLDPGNAFYTNAAAQLRTIQARTI